MKFQQCSTAIEHIEIQPPLDLGPVNIATTGVDALVARDAGAREEGDEVADGVDLLELCQHWSAQGPIPDAGCGDGEVQRGARIRRLDLS